MADQTPAASQNKTAEYLEEHNIISDEVAEEIGNALKGGSLEKAASKIRKNLQALESACLNIAVTGESGSGKSSFVNAIRGLGDKDEGSAPTDVTQTTMEVTGYPHPKLRRVTVWDLPGIGTPDFQAGTYLEQVKFSRYDFFIIIASERFKSTHVQLAREIKRMEKSFYFVRSKVDSDLDASKRRQGQNYKEDLILKQIKQDCQKGLLTAGVASPQVFLLCTWELDKYDFALLEETLEKELPRHKRHAFLLALPNISEDILQKKKSVLQGQIWQIAILSCGAAAVPIPGLSVICDVKILMDSLSSYRQHFGLDEESLNRLAKKVGKPVRDLKEVIKSPLAGEITKEKVLKLLMKGGEGAMKLWGLFTKGIPILGLMVAGGLSFASTYHILWSSLNEIAEDAQNVLNKALESTD